MLIGIYETVSGTRSLKYIITPHGRAVKSGSSWIYNYNITDHLGNVRAEITPYIGGAPLINQARNYYTFGMEMSQLNTGTTANKYQYNGKEIQDDFGLYWYDYGARFYDPMVGRWHTIDPMAESYYSFSPFHFSGNNPMKFLDLNGMNYDWVEKAGGGELVWDDKVTSANDKDLQKGDKYLGKAVVVFGGSTDEKLGKGQNLFGEGAKLANVTVYGPDGADDVKTYKGFTMSSDFSKWGAVADGDYSVNYDDKGKSGALTSNWAVNARGKVPALGGINPSPYGEFDDSKVGIFIHSSNSDGFAGNYISKRDGKIHGISEGCLLIAPSRKNSDGSVKQNGWNQFNQQLSGVKQIHMKIRR